MHPAFLSKLPALLAGALLPLALAGGAHAEKITGPFAYPTGLLDAPATLTTPLGRDARESERKQGACQEGREL